MYKVWTDENCQGLVSVPFLPENIDVSSTINQGRQKLTHYTEKEFKDLVNLILIEINRSNQPYEIFKML